MPKSMGDGKPKNFGKTVKRFAACLKPWRWSIVLAIVFMVISSILSVFGPMLLGNVTTSAVDSLTSTGALDWGVISSLLIWLAFLYVASAIFNYLQNLVLALVAERYGQKLREQILEKIAKLPVSYFDQHQFGDTLSRMSNDVDTIASSLARVLAEVFSDVIVMIGTLVMMMVISVPLSLISLLVIPFSVFFISKIAKKAQDCFRAQRTILGEVNNIVEEDYSGQLVIQANSYEPQAIKKFGKTNQRLYNASWQAQFFGSMAYPIISVFTNLSYALVCIIGGDLVIKGKLAIGQIQSFLQYVNQFNRPLSGVAQIAANIQGTMAAAERVFNFLDEKEEAPDAEPAQIVKEVKGKVEFHHVDFSYNPEKEIIKNFSVKIKPGMQVAIVGPTGAGKTTIINLLMRFYDPTNGYISIDGVPTREMKRADVRKMFGMVLQDTWLFSGTIEDNLRYGRSGVSHDDVVKAAKMSSIHHFIESLPHGYKTEISEDSDNISAGEKQLLTIARAMVANPPMMILDEATSNVDTRTEQLIQDAFAKLTHGRTSFVIAHRLSTIRNSDLILVMKEGKIVEQGKHEELLKENGFYAELYNSQFADS